MDIFQEKNIKPMLIGASSEPFDSDDYLFELKMDGERCVAYLDKKETELRNKRNKRLLIPFPEMDSIHKYIKSRCILDGEIFVLQNGRPEFEHVSRRSIMTNKMKIEIASKNYPASFVAFDILYYKDKDVTKLPLSERKQLLLSVINDENNKFAYSRTIENQGIALYHAAKERELEGIVAKRKESLYFFGKETKDWIKIKYMQHEDMIICGYIPKSNHMTSAVLGQYNSDGDLVYKGHVTFGVRGENFKKITAISRIDSSPFINIPTGNESAIWIEPVLVCVVEYMKKSSKGNMRQPVFKGLRDDKSPRDCVET